MGADTPITWPPGDSEMAQRIRAHEWAKTPLGSIDGWPGNLRTLVDVVLGSGMVMCLMWDRAGVMVYNDAYAWSIGQRHPAALGRSAHEVWADVRDGWEPLFERAWSGEEATVRNQHLHFARPDVLRQEAWFDITYTPVRNEGGAVEGVLALVRETTDRVLAEQRREESEVVLRESEERQAFLLKLSDAFRAETNPDTIGALATRMVGEHMQVDRCYIARFAREEERGWIGPEHRSDALPPLAGEYRFADFPKGMKRIETGPLIIRDLLNDASLSHADKESMGKAMGMHGMLAAVLRKGERNYFWCLTAATTGPRDWTDGEVKFLEDVAERTWAAMERARAEGALRESEERFRTVVESARDYAIFTTDADGFIQTWPPGAEAVFGWTAEEAMGQDAAITFTPEDRASGQPLKEMAEARANGVAPNVRWHMRKDGARVFLEGSTRLLRERHTGPRGFLKIGQDVTERHRAEERLKESEARLQVMLSELQHRTRNLISVVGAVSNQTLGEAESLTDFRHRFSDRLTALSRVQGLLSRLSAGARVTFDELLRSELAALGAPAHKVTLDGPAGVPLRSGTVQTFSLALHEMATNAVKYGALATDTGHLTVRWSMTPSGNSVPRLHVYWYETGVDMTEIGDRPRGGGYGRELIERALPYQLGAETTYELTTEGVRCTIDVEISVANGEGS